MAPGYLAPGHHRTRYASPLTFPRRSARTSENALRTTVSHPAGTTIVERLFDHAQDAPIHSICVDEALRKDWSQPCQGIAEDDDRALLLADLETIPGQPRYW